MWFAARMARNICHPERSEGSPYYILVILRCAQDDIKALGVR